jgi:hypothetical protein
VPPKGWERDTPVAAGRSPSTWVALKRRRSTGKGREPWTPDSFSILPISNGLLQTCDPAITWTPTPLTARVHQS